MRINVYMRHAVTEALGPGKRYALWVQGCRRRCRGCISPDSRNFNGGSWMDVLALAEEIIHIEGNEGITISGGEPFLQAEALCELIAHIKRKKDYGVMVYTGNTYEELCCSEDVFVQRLLSYTDILVDGEYIEELNDGKSLRGSSNQRALFLTGRYEGIRNIFGKAGRDVELYIDSKVRMVGIPSKEILDRLGIRKEAMMSERNEKDEKRDVAVQMSKEQENAQMVIGKKTAIEELKELVGCNELKQCVKKLEFMIRLENDESINLNCLITGNPGTGKTKTAMLLSRIYKEMGLLKSGHIVVIRAKDLIASCIGQTTVNTEKRIIEAMGGVLFIDDVHELFEEKYGELNKEAVETLVQCMEEHRGRFAVIMAGYPIAVEMLQKLNAGIIRRYFLNSVFNIEDYMPKELHQIFAQIMEREHLRPDEELSELLPAFFENFVRTKGNRPDCVVWGNAHEVRSLIDEIIEQCACLKCRIIQEDGGKIGIVTKGHIPARLQSLL